MVERSENVDSEENQLMTAGTEIQPAPLSSRRIPPADPGDGRNTPL